MAATVAAGPFPPGVRSRSVVTAGSVRACGVDADRAGPRTSVTRR
ncbi:hypothetical protein [Prescottella sp. R16]|nr:hypothetical protein [Prescottella sp. R16]